MKESFILLYWEVRFNEAYKKRSKCVLSRYEIITSLSLLFPLCLSSV